eukprot:4603020-Pyramimonas_sp.AAC.1
MVYVVHAPYKGHREIQLASWWRDLSGLAEKWPPTILLGDCNANIPNHTVYSETLEDIVVGHEHPACAPTAADEAARACLQFATDTG